MRDGIIRAKLKLEFRNNNWVARGYVPVKGADGQIARKRVERGVGADLKTKAERQAFCDRLNKFYEDRATSTVKSMSFAKAYTNYIEAGHRVPYYAKRILQALGLTAVSEIDDTVMLQAVKVVFPNGVKPSTINRELYTPVVAILNMAARSKACAPPNFTRPKGYTDAPPVQIPDKDWFRRVIPHMSPDRVALICFLSVHGRRLGDALNRSPEDFDPAAGTLAVGRDKTGNALSIILAPGVRDLLAEMPGWQDREWLFGVGPSSGSNVRRDILLACLKAAGLEVALLRGKGGQQRARRALAGAGLKYYGPHAIGRHSFATRLLRAGYSLHHVKESGGWATIAMVSQRYGHLARSETTSAVHATGEAWLDENLNRGGS